MDYAPAVTTEGTIEESVSPYRCRPATPADFPRIAEMGRSFYEQTVYRKVPYSEEGLANHWCPMMLEQRLLFVAERDGHVIGAIGGISSPFLMNPAYGAGAELFMWVEPEHRGSRVSGELMDLIERSARDSGVTYWSMIALDAVQPEIAAKIYAKRGYVPAERTFVKEL